MSTDRIEKKILLRAPIQRVWAALSDSTQFGTWFGTRFDGPFVPGKKITGKIVPTGVNEQVAKSQKTYEGLPIDMYIEKMEPEHLLSLRWHPNATERNVDYSSEPTTLVVFTLEQVPEGVMLTVSETGFDQVPLSRRAKAFSSNDRGWGMVVTMIEEYLVRTQ
jgi:uncharacterized protein YndB with AHSA1/START domain